MKKAMLDKYEKKVLIYLIENCSKKQVSLIHKEDVIKNMSKNFALSLSTLDDIMLSLSKDNYIDYISSESKKGPAYCITLKNKALTFNKDQKKQKKYAYFLIFRTIGLAILSFLVGIILKVIFS